MLYALPEDQIAIRDMARDFASQRIAPHALDWDRNGPPAQFLPGNELAEALGIDTGPRIGEVMKELSAARFAGEINDANEAVVHARRFLEAG